MSNNMVGVFTGAIRNLKKYTNNHKYHASQPATKTECTVIKQAVAQFTVAICLIFMHTPSLSSQELLRLLPKKLVNVTKPC